MKGWVYVISNKAMPGLVKVGYSMKDPELRAKELDNTGSPYPYIVDYEVLVEDPREVEQKVHSHLKHFKEEKEWFRCSGEEAIASIQAIVGSAALMENFKRADRERAEAIRQKRQAEKDAEALRLQREKEERARQRREVEERAESERKHREAEERALIESLEEEKAKRREETLSKYGDWIDLLSFALFGPLWLLFCGAALLVLPNIAAVVVFLLGFFVFYFLYKRIKNWLVDYLSNKKSSSLSKGKHYNSVHN